MAYKWLGNAFIATVPQNPILKDCIDRIVKHCKVQTRNVLFRLYRTSIIR